jgi:hypothetical protein
MLEITQHQDRSFGVVTHRGSVCTNEIKEAREMLRGLCSDDLIHRVFVDLRQASLNLTMRDALTLAEATPPNWPQAIKIALVSSQEQHRCDEALALYVLAAANRGHNVRLFENPEAAETWLLD